MQRESWQARLSREAEEAIERAKGRPQPWLVYADGLFRDLFAEGDDRYVMDRTLFAMRMAVPREPTDRESCSVYHLGGIERIVADEADMPAVMRCVRLTGLHGTYRKAGETKEYKF